MGTLHIACCFDAPVDVLEAIHAVHPNSAVSSKNYGYTPLHYTCIRSSSERTLEFLLAVAPRTAATTDHFGKLPLHNAVKYLKDPSFVERLLAAYPEAVRVTRGGDTLLCTFLNAWSKRETRATMTGVLDLSHLRPTEYYVRIFSSLFRAYSRGHSKNWYLAHETVRCHNTVPIPVPLVFAVLRTRTEKCCAWRPDQVGNFPLHVACTVSRHSTDD